MTAKMGELGVANPKGNVPSKEGRVGFGSGWKSCPPPDLASITAEHLTAAEEAAEQVLKCVHPRLDSEEKRRDVIDYVQQLVQNLINCEVVSYGSVPLKTYLPDGDIDLIVLKSPDEGESLAHDVLALLQDEEKKENAEYQIKETQFIDAEVKLVKCFVRNFVVDISFNQLGGLSTLCFLEQVDRLVGRNHLFKRSIILVKTWCYYESRILGGHHGLISTYALEILVLYIFHHFHSLLTGPLSVLYKFLDYYSQFDWENYCISLKGPVCKSSLPDIVVEMPEGGWKWNHLLLSEEFIENCLELFSVSSRGPEANLRAFQSKHLNIIDPLKKNNNLGRSVNRGNFYRIRSAFKFGAHKLGRILLLPIDEVADEICNFFTNTCSRHGRQYKSSIRRLAFDFGVEKFFTESSATDFYNLSAKIGHMPSLDLRNEAVDRQTMGEVSPGMTTKISYSSDGVLVSRYRVSGAKHGLATINSRSNYTASRSDYHLHNPRSKSSTENGISEFDNRNQLVEMKSTYQWPVSKNMSSDFREMESRSVGGDSEAFNPLADLSGDYDGNIRSLLRGQLCHGFSLSSNVRSDRPSSPHRFQNRMPRNVILPSMPLKMNNNNSNNNNDDNNNNNKFSQMSSHVVSTDHTLYSGPDFHLSGNALQFDGIQKSPGTGTYFPQMNPVLIESSSYGRGKNKGGNENQLHRHVHANGIHSAGRMKSFENGGHQENGCLSALCRIEFGSIGTLGEQVISRSAPVNGSTMGASLKAQGSSAVLIQQRDAGQSIRLKSDDEFPPLCQH